MDDGFCKTAETEYSLQYVLGRVLPQTKALIWPMLDLHDPTNSKIVVDIFRNAFLIFPSNEPSLSLTNIV
jgi:hypothetical protein